MPDFFRDPAAFVLGMICGGYLITTLLGFVARSLLRGRWEDEEIRHRPSSVLAGAWLRHYAAWATRPLLAGVSALGLPPLALTNLSVLLSLSAGVAVAADRLALGGWLMLLGGCCDFLDGRLARATGTASRKGAALDSVLDRLADNAVLVGVAWCFRDSWVLFCALLLLVATNLIPYVRARAESLGVPLTIGLMQRTERVLYLGGALILSPAADVLAPFGAAVPHPLLAFAVCALSILAVTTVAQRLVFLLAALDQEPPARWFGVHRRLLYRNIVAAIAATAVDFQIVLAFVSVLSFEPWLATLVGCLAGAAVNLTINRLWTFQSTSARLPQAARYAVVSTTSALLNSGGVALTALLLLDYRVGWLLARITVFMGWNFPLHQHYVFNDKAELADLAAQPEEQAE